MSFSLRLNFADTLTYVFIMCVDDEIKRCSGVLIIRCFTVQIVIQSQFYNLGSLCCPAIIGITIYHKHFVCLFDLTNYC